MTYRGRIVITKDLLHETLQLPKEWRITHMIHDPNTDTMQLYVTGAGLWYTRELEELVRVEPSSIQRVHSVIINWARCPEQP